MAATAKQHIVAFRVDETVIRSTRYMASIPHDDIDSPDAVSVRIAEILQAHYKGEETPSLAVQAVAEFCEESSTTHEAKWDEDVPEPEEQDIPF